MIDLLIACPRHGDVRGPFALSLAELAHELGQSGGRVRIAMPNSTDLCGSRSKLVVLARERSYRHILWADTDMTFPSDAAHRLLAHGLDIVGCNYSRKSAARKPTAYKADFSGNITPHAGLEDAAVIGFGLLLMKTAVFETIERPWFLNEPIPPDNLETLTDDVWMCRKLREAGHRIYVDHDLSREVTHVGEYPYSLVDKQ